MSGSETRSAVTGRARFVGPAPATQSARQPDVATAHLAPSSRADAVSAGASERTSGVPVTGGWDAALRRADRGHAPTDG